MSDQLEKWKALDQRLRALDFRDENESDLIAEAYDALIMDYREARELNREMEEIVYRNNPNLSSHP